VPERDPEIQALLDKQTHRGADAYLARWTGRCRDVARVLSAGCRRGPGGIWEGPASEYVDRSPRHRTPKSLTSQQWLSKS